MKITAVVPKWEPRTEYTTARDFHAVDRFARAVGDASGTEVGVIEGTIDDAPVGYILAFELPGSVDTAHGPRIIAIGVDRSTIMKRVEDQHLAGAVEFYRYFMWTAQPEKERGEGLVGRKDLAERLNAQIRSGPYTSANYSWLASDAATDLPSLIAAYLRALSQARP
jgi:hypothetical protein